MNEAATGASTASHIRYRQCSQCGKTWYFQRDFCPACGHRAVQTQASRGRGVLYASTIVHRAPAEAFKPLLPYCIVLVDMQEGFRVMGQADAGLALDTPVRGELRPIAGQLLPYFVKDDDA